MFTLEYRRKAEDIFLEEKTHYHFQVFHGVSHGFAVRGDMDEEMQRWAKEECARGFAGWFNRFRDL